MLARSALILFRTLICFPLSSCGHVRTLWDAKKCFDQLVESHENERETSVEQRNLVTASVGLSCVCEELNEAESTKIG